MVKRLKKFRRKLLSPAGLLVLLLVLAFIGFGLWRNSHDQKTTTTISGEQVKPPTAEEKAAGDARKDQIVEDQQKQANSDNSQLKKVGVVITEANESSVRGYVQGVFEEGGTCTATATKGSQTITKSSSGFGNVSYTQCAPINWNSSLSSGSWTVNLVYKSATAQGNTDKTIEIK